MPLICARVEGSDRSVNVGSFTAIDDRSCDDGGFAGAAAFNRPAATEKKHRRAACPPAAAPARENRGE